MSYSVASYTGDGSAVNFAVPFPFVNRTHVTATVDGVSTAFTWLSDGLITFGAAPAIGKVIKITRNTSQSVRLVDFQDATVLTEVALDTANLQAFYMAQEAFDASAAMLNSTELANSVAAAAASAAAAAASAILAGGYASAALGYLNSNLKTSDRFEIVSQTQYNALTSELFAPEFVLTNNFNPVNHRKWKMGVFSGDQFALGPENDVEDTGLTQGLSMNRAAGGGNSVDSITLWGTTISLTGATTLGGAVTMLSDLTFSGTTAKLVSPVSIDSNGIPKFKIKATGTTNDVSLGLVPAGTNTGIAYINLSTKDHTDHASLVVQIDPAGDSTINSTAHGANSALALTMQVGGTTHTRYHGSGRQSIGGATDDGVTPVQILGTTKFSQDVSVAGNVTLSGSAKRFMADFSNATASNRMAFQSSTVNGFTSLTVIPNGTSQQAFIQLMNNSDQTQPLSYGDIRITAGAMTFTSNQLNAGTVLPMTFTVGSTRMRVTAAGLLTVGEPTDDTTSILQLNGNQNFFGSARRIKADLSDATVVNRLCFQSNVVNGVSSLGVIPNGTATTANVRVFNNSDLTAAAAFCNFQVTSSAVVLDSNVINAGTQLPITFAIAGVVKQKIDNNGNTILSNAIADQSYSLQTPLTGASITIGNNISTLLLNPAGTIATLTVTMPAAPIDGQIVRLASTQTVTALTLNANAGQTISGNVATLTAAAPATYMYNLSGTKWYHVQ